MYRSTTGLLVAFMAMLGYASCNIAVKASNHWVTTWQSGFGRFAFGLVALPVLAWIFKLDLRWRDHGWLLLRALTGSASFMLMVLAFETVPLSSGVILLYLCPALTALLAPLILGERTPAGDWPYIAGAFAGMVIILWPGWGGFQLRIGHLLAIASALTWAVTIASTRRVVKSVTPWGIYLQVCVVGLIMCGIPLLIEGQSPAPVGWQGWLGLSVTAVGAMVAQVATNRSLLFLAAHHMAVILSLEVVIATLFGVLILGDQLTWRLVTGGLLIVGCGLILNWRKGS